MTEQRLNELTQQMKSDLQPITTKVKEFEPLPEQKFRCAFHGEISQAVYIYEADKFICSHDNCAGAIKDNLNDADFDDAPITDNDALYAAHLKQSYWLQGQLPPSTETKHREAMLKMKSWYDAQDVKPKLLGENRSYSAYCDICNRNATNSKTILRASGWGIYKDHVFCPEHERAV